MSGIASYTRQIVDLLAGSRTKFLDTRKTTPNMRVFEKYAVKVGGGCNHRYNLSDGILLKDNHMGVAGNVTKENVANLVSVGVDYISSGALTRSAPILDISLKNLHPVL